ncbi:hypothetical protein PIB30_046253 [Stylosanthes scabra]|uniref:Uncharacterized protein n=1 Tax=Stylosanthes scabra TaxID=79078 RepID=A0ABU6WG44_9FABA|nr:hypothetical protein [Stylosanthes scabra]
MLYMKEECVAAVMRRWEKDSKLDTSSSTVINVDSITTTKNLVSGLPKILQDLKKYVEWAQHDSTLIIWLDASMTITYRNKVVHCTAFAKNWDQINHIFIDSLHSILHPFIEDDYIQAILDGFLDEYDGYVTSIMSRMTSFTIHEAESSLKAYEDRINRKDKNTPMAHLAEAPTTPTTD